MEGVAKGAEWTGMQGLEHAARSTINVMETGAKFGDSILMTGQARALENAKLLRALGKRTETLPGGGEVIAKGESLTKTDLAKSLFYNKEGKFQKGRAIAAGAGSYMAANVVGNGSLGIPFISTASWNR